MDSLIHLLLSIFPFLILVEVSAYAFKFVYSLIVSYWG